MNSPPWHTTQGALGFAAPVFEEAAGDGAAWMNAGRMLRRRVRLIVVLTILACILALPAILAIPKTYYAETRVLVSPAPALAMASQLEGREVSFDLDTELERLLSAAVVDEVVARFDLAAREEFNEDLLPPTPIDRVKTTMRAAIDAMTGAAPAAETGETTGRRVDAAFRNALSVGNYGESGVVAVGFVSQDPVLAAAVPGAMIETWARHGQERWQAEADEAIAWLDARITSQRSRAEAAQAAVDEELRRVGLTGVATPDAASADLVRIGERLSELERERLDLALTRRSVEAARRDPELPAAAEPPGIGELRDDLRSLQRELERVRVVYGAQHESVLAQSGRVEAAEAELVAALAAFDRSLQDRDDVLAVEIARLRDEASAARTVLAAMRSAVPVLEQKADVVAARDQTLQALESYRDEMLSHAEVPPLSLETISPAQVPLYPLGPGRKVYMLGTAFVALIVAAMFAVALELGDTRVRSHEQLRQLAGLVPVGLWRRAPGRKVRATAGNILQGVSSPQTEAVQDMITLIESAHGAAMPPVLTVIAPRSEDKALPVAEWIALTLAVSGHRVQLVGSEASQPRGARQGSSAAGRKSAEHDNLVRIPFAEFYHQASAGISTSLLLRSDSPTEPRTITIVDAPPLLSQGALRFGLLDAPVLLTLRWGRTPRAVVDYAQGLLVRPKGPPVFTLITDANPRRHRLYGFKDRLSLAPPAPAG